MKIYIHPNCNSCKKALKWLEQNNLQAEVINLLETTPSENELQQILDHYKGNLKKLFNTSGQLYREKGIKDQIPTISKQDAITLLREEGMLIKRPFLISPQHHFLGFKEVEWNAILN